MHQCYFHSRARNIHTAARFAENRSIAIKPIARANKRQFAQIANGDLDRMNYNLTSPCDNCPFRSDIEPFITPERMEEIANSDGVFPCHKTTVSCENDDDGNDLRATENSQHCAGFLILLEKMEQPNQMMRIAERLGFYDRTKLDMDAPVYDDLDEMLSAYEKAESKI